MRKCTHVLTLCVRRDVYKYFVFTYELLETNVECLDYCASQFMIHAINRYVNMYNNQICSC